MLRFVYPTCPSKCLSLPSGPGAALLSLPTGPGAAQPPCHQSRLQAAQEEGEQGGGHGSQHSENSMSSLHYSPHITLGINLGLIYFWDQ